MVRKDSLRSLTHANLFYFHNYEGVLGVDVEFDYIITMKIIRGG